MLHSSTFLRILVEYLTICIIVKRFLILFSNSICLKQEAFINLSKARLYDNVSPVSRQNLSGRPYELKLSPTGNPVDRKAHFTQSSHKPKSNFLSECIERGMVSQTTDFMKIDELLAEYENKNLNNEMCASVYYGIDCTNDFIHEGTLFQLMFLRRFLSQRFNVVLVIGGGTTLVGDPSYKLRKNRQDSAYFSEVLGSGDGAQFDTSREEAISSVATKILSLPMEVNGELIRPKVHQIEDLESEVDVVTEMCNPYKVFVFNNRDLYKKVNLMEYLESVARNMNVGRMLARDCVKMRIVEKDGEHNRRSVNMDLSELMYMSLQAMDFVYLAQRMNCKIQLGGNDQMGNIVSGIELAESLGISNVFGLTTPLLEDKFGEKISKSGSNCFLKITKETSPHEFWSHFRSIDDSLVERYIKWFTKVPLERIEESISDHYNTAKMLLADELTGVIYGKQVVDLIHKFCLSKRFEDLVPFMKSKEVDLGTFQDLVNLTKLVPNYELTSAKLKEGVDLVLVLDTLRVPQFSNSSFHSNKRFIKEGACRINGQVVDDIGYKLTQKDVVKLTNCGKEHKYILIQLGKRKLYFVIVT
ncbi:tyrosyl-tRNA synthetase [Theileria orientalis strain Shintoku]|uniref:tyrosine--tRNA ligase n=1 Tax=Theileria orientalis strain Shintoku TaxID=869250 RepID=J4D5Z1_THEOR|nr:tyrosyl-tRNA synthetase [Theileria orientalis strain Shintoku]PVC50745.1 tyrosyl-tRNA synthetase [Theileria orientalis]BAM39255.1 tyrosyl-tRNA synthetase [Theileria orientalis strain Shintoku]|eukprot:XP_009689556.1 tyrosyl-tRNA synthetase [Theileria orientalis strain Shintoku]